MRNPEKQGVTLRITTPKGCTYVFVHQEFADLKEMFAGALAVNDLLDTLIDGMQSEAYDENPERRP